MTEEQINQQIAQIELDMNTNWAMMGRASHNIQVLQGQLEAIKKLLPEKKTE